ncbi:MAG: FKBP-type peptidyl-prolyl cis-trans isomerase [Hymenobacter sp.]
MVRHHPARPGPTPQKRPDGERKVPRHSAGHGQEFDSSAKHGGTPFDFVLAAGRGVIEGWDQGIAVLPKGSKAMLLIPSPLAYGERGGGKRNPRPTRRLPVLMWSWWG